MAAIASSCQLVVPSAAVAKVAAPKRQARIASFGQFSGLKASSCVSAVAERKTVDESFAQIAADARRTGARGGALSSRCDIGAEIIRVVPIIGGMIFTGIALGFVLLRVEAWVEEEES
ncbi:hypothetical protein CLOM_g15961 [Closterium sp. NIES-68]|nr:hypothetical protein CLOM_g15662 [Closterium sp. NIES-68]GJP56904.1 hypothetical protein CLOM_g15961 [Closterium sp. NIES-68]GJP59792.1 hypothetical protein CLOP_g15250 [Closterium sp. NIES-67]